MKQTVYCIFVQTVFLIVEYFSCTFDCEHIWNHANDTRGLFTNPLFGYLQNVVLHDLAHNSEELLQFGLLLGFFDRLIHVEPPFAYRNDLFADDVLHALYPCNGQLLFN